MHFHEHPALNKAAGFIKTESFSARIKLVFTLSIFFNLIKGILVNWKESVLLSQSNPPTSTSALKKFTVCPHPNRSLRIPKVGLGSTPKLQS